MRGKEGYKWGFSDRNARAAHAKIRECQWVRSLFHIEAGPTIAQWGQQLSNESLTPVSLVPPVEGGSGGQQRKLWGAYGGQS